MEWQPWYKFVIIGLIGLIAKALQQNTTKKYEIINNEAEEEKSDSSNIQDNNRNLNDRSSEESVYNLISELIDEMGYILISKNMTNNLYYEITFKNYEKNFLEFKRVSTFIKLTGNDKSKEISYSTWSERYEYGQNSHNDKIAQDFLTKLKERIK